MEPQIQYVKTSDGVSIAYYAIGQGPATLYLNMTWSHLEAEWQIDPLRIAFTAVAQRYTLIRLDPRGFGLSDRDPDDFALDSLVLDIEAVVDRLGLDALSIYSVGLATVPALAYTARHPDKVTHLVQEPAATSGEDVTSERVVKLAELAKIDWALATETAIRTLLPDFSDQLVRDVAGLMLVSIEPTSVVRLIADMRRWDADADATSLSTPTLLIHQRNNPNISIATTRRVAALIKDSRVAFVDGAFEGAALAQRFFEDELPDLTEPASVQTATPPKAATLRTILFTDMEGSTSLTQRLGDAKAHDVLRTHNRIVRDALKAHNGTEIKHTGDGIMASFTSASTAIEAAVAIQKALADHNNGNSDTPIRVRIGLNAGEPVAEDEDLFGTAVQLAARVCDKAEPGQILVADVVEQLAAGKGFTFADQGETSLKGFEKTVRLHEVSWHD